MKPGGGRTKGQNAERNRVNFLKARNDDPEIAESWKVKRNHQEGIYDDLPDVSADGCYTARDQNKAVSLNIEVKIGGKVPKFYYDALKQAKQDEGISVVFARRDREKWIACLLVDDLMELIS